MRCEICNKVIKSGSEIVVNDGKYRNPPILDCDMNWFLCSKQCEQEIIEEIEFAESTSRDDNHLDFI